MATSAMKKPSKDPREPFMAFVEDDVTREVLVRAVEHCEWPPNQVFTGDVHDAIRALADIPTPELLLVDLSGSVDPIEDINGLAEVCDFGTRVIAVGSVNDVELFRKLVAAGVDDYLLKPVSVEPLVSSLTRVTDEPEEETAGSDDSQGRMIVTIGARGGVGASTLAVNAAWMIAHELERRVALVDLDLYFGTAALSLDLEPGRGFREALENPSRIDGLFIERAMVKESDKLYVLAAEESLDKPVRFDPSSSALLVEKLRQPFDCVLVELPRAFVASHHAVISTADVVTVVSDLSLAGMRDTLRLVGHVKQVAPAAEIRVVANRVGQAKGAEMTKKDFEAGIKEPIAYELPYEQKPLAQSSSTGKPVAVVARGSKYVAAMRSLSQDMAATDEAAAQAPLWKRLLKK
jgi:pilus assembly protein CpaE